MRIKRIVCLIAMAAFASTAFFVPAVYAEEVELSREKINLMMAAGEIPPVPQISEEDVKIKRDKAIKIAGEILGDASGFESSDAYLNPGYGNMGPAWSINFHGESGDPAVNVSINVGADTGDIIGYNRWNGNSGQQNYVARFTRAEALAAADDFMKNRLKFSADDYELQPGNPYENSYGIGGVKQPFSHNFTYIRKLNGIYLPADTVYIGVDGTNGEVTGFSRNPSTIDMGKLPSAEDVLSPDKILPVYRSSLDLDLQYITRYRNDPYSASQTEVSLAYIPAYIADLIDAKKGVPVNYDGAQIITGNPERPAVETVPMDPAAVLPPAAAKTEAEAGAIAEAYRRNVEKLLGIKFDDTASSRQVYYPQNDAGYFNWSKNSETANYSLNMSVDKKTGRVGNLQFSRYDMLYEKMLASGQKPPEVKAGIAWDAGREKALETVKQIVPDQYGFFAEQSVKEPEISAEVGKTMREYNYYFIRIVNGIPFRDNTISVNIDRETGEVQNFYMNWTEAGFPKVDGVITKAAAEENYFKGLGARLQYLQKVSYDQQTQIVRYDPVPLLVYSIVRSGAGAGAAYIDAVTGKLVDFSGREIKPDASAAEPTPGGSWAQRSVELLTAQGIIKDPYIGYDSELTRAEAVKMLSVAKGIQYYYDYSQLTGQSFTDVPRDSEYFMYVENAVSQGIIAKGTEFRGGEKITREEFAKLLVNLTGYAELAEKTAIFKTEGLKVSDPADAGYVAICSALDFLPVKPGEAFDGSGRVTLAEAAAALYKALSYIR